MLYARRIYRDEYELLHDGMKRIAAARDWEVIERPTEVDPEQPPDPRLITLEHLGLERLRPVVEPPELAEADESMACETCMNRHNPPGDGPCVDCDLTIDGPQSNYVAEGDHVIDVEDVVDVSGPDDDEDDDDTQNDGLDE